MSLLISLRSEILKTKRTASLYLVLAAAVFGPLMSMLDMLFDEGISAESGKTILNDMFTKKFEMTGFLIFPMLIMLICTLMAQLEYKNNAWKQVLSSPQSKANVFVAKFLNIQFFLVLFIVANQLGMLVTAVILHFIKPELHVLSQPLDGYKLWTILVNSYAAMLALCAIQFWLSLRFKNFIISLGIGIGCWFIGSILALEVKSDLANYFPYSYHVLSSFPKFQANLITVVWYSLGYTVLFLALGLIDFMRKGKG